MQNTPVRSYCLGRVPTQYQSEEKIREELQPFLELSGAWWLLSREEVLLVGEVYVCVLLGEHEPTKTLPTAEKMFAHKRTKAQGCPPREGQSNNGLKHGRLLSIQYYELAYKQESSDVSRHIPEQSQCSSSFHFVGSHEGSVGHSDFMIKSVPL